MPGRAFPFQRPEHGTYRWFQSQLGRRMQLGPNPDTWQHDEIEEVYDLINRGANQVYYPPAITGPPHKWSFLKVEYRQQLSTNDADYTLPDDCGGIVGRLAFSQDDSGYTNIAKTTVQNILSKRSVNTDVSGYPTLYAERPGRTDGQEAQPRLLMLWPDPDAAYTVHGEYEVEPQPLSDERPHPYGGKWLVEALLASMLQLADPRMMPQFEQALSAAIQYDLMHHQPEFLGKNLNGNRGWSSTRDSRGRFENFDNVTYNGSTYDGS